MKTLTMTTKGQVTLRKDLLRHLGVAPGQRIEVRAAKPAGTIEEFIGVLADEGTTRSSGDEMNEA